MKNCFRMIACCLSVCLLLSVCPAAAEECGIGDAVSIVRETDSSVTVHRSSGEDGEYGVAGVQSGTSAAESSGGTKDLVTRMYQVTLGREPDPQGLSAWTKALDDGTLSAADLVLGFLGSQEYLNSGKSNEEIVTDCYHAMLGREPDQAGLAGWKQSLDIGMSPRRICAGFVGSVEFNNLAASYGIRTGTIDVTAARDRNYELTYFVYRLYANCLERKPDIGGLEDWCSVLNSGGSGVNAAYGFIFSQEYRNRHMDNGEYVNMLYRTILGRESEPVGYTGWKNALDYTNTRERVLNGFLFSPEFLNQCSRAGISLGNPVDEPDDTESWKYNVRILELANEDRALEGADPLTLREDLWSDIAGVRARELPELFEHTRPDGTDCFTAFDDAGLEYWTAGENIAYGYGTPEAVYAGWMNSPGHHANLMNKAFEHIGTYYYKDRRPYWAQLFFTPYIW